MFSSQPWLSLPCAVLDRVGPGSSLVWKAVVTGTPTGLLSQCTTAAMSSLGPSFVTEAHLQMHYFHQESNTAAGAGAGNAG